MPPRRRRSQREQAEQPCVVCAQILRPGTFEEPDVSCDGCSNDARIGHKRAPVAHITCILPGGTDDDDDARKGWILDQDGETGVTTWLCQSCRRRTMDPEGAPAPAPAAAEPSPLAPAPAAVAPPPPPPEPSLPPPVAAALPSGEPAAEDASLPQDFICPITQAPMVDPCVCADGHSYERTAIAAWLETHDTSPQTNLPLEHKQLVPNTTLRNLIRNRVPAPAAPEPAPAPESRSRSRGRRRRSRSRSRRRRRSRGRRRRSRSRSRSRRRRSRRRRSRSRSRSREMPWGSPLTNPALQRGRAYSKAPRRHRSRSRG